MTLSSGLIFENVNRAESVN